MSKPNSLFLFFLLSTVLGGAFYLYSPQKKSQIFPERSPQNQGPTKFTRETSSFQFIDIVGQNVAQVRYSYDNTPMESIFFQVAMDNLKSLTPNEQQRVLRDPNVFSFIFQNYSNIDPSQIPAEYSIASLAKKVDLCNTSFTPLTNESPSSKYNMAEELLLKKKYRALTSFEETFSTPGCIRPEVIKTVREELSNSSRDQKDLDAFHRIFPTNKKDIIPWPIESTLSENGRNTIEENNQRIVRNSEALKLFGKKLPDCLKENDGSIDINSDMHLNFCVAFYSFLSHFPNPKLKTLSLKKCHVQFYGAADNTGSFSTQPSHGQSTTSDKLSRISIFPKEKPQTTVPFKILFDYSMESCPGFIITHERKTNSLQLKNKLSSLSQVNDIPIIDIYNLDFSKFRCQMDFYAKECKSSPSLDLDLQFQPIND